MPGKNEDTQEKNCYIFFCNYNKNVSVLLILQPSCLEQNKIPSSFLNNCVTVGSEDVLFFLFVSDWKGE